MVRILLVSILSLFFAQHSFAAPATTQFIQWGDMDRGDQFVLKKSLHINQTLTLKAGTTFTAHDMTPLGEVQVEAFEFSFAPCSPSIDSATIDMTILNNLYGFELDSHCSAVFYVEFKDFYRDSYFEKKQP